MGPKRLTGSSILALGLCLALHCHSARAQSKYVAIPLKGDTEIGGFLGGSYGLDSWRVMGGGNFAYAIHKIVMPYVEYNYFPGIQRQFTTSRGGVNFSVPCPTSMAASTCGFRSGNRRLSPME